MDASFHRGLTTWVATFEFDGRERMAWLERRDGRWIWPHMDRYDLATLGELDYELTEKLKEWLKENPVPPKS